MSFYKKYELQRLIADGEAKTFRAVENSTGRLVYLHLFNSSGQRLMAILKSKLASVPGKPVAPLLEIGEFAGSPFAVTLPIEPFSSLRDWVALNLDISDPKIAEESPVIRTAPAPPETAAEITPVPPLVSDTPAPPAPSPISSPPPVPAPPSLTADQAGEFTRQFEQGMPAKEPVKEKPIPPRATPRTPSSPVPSSPPVATPADLVVDQPGEFTRLFEQRKGPVPEKPMPPRATPPGAGLVADQRGEFTRIFDSGPPNTSIPSPGGPAPGEFTRLFEVPPSAPPPAAPPDQGGGFTRLFQAPLGSAEPVKSAPPAPDLPRADRRPGASFRPAASPPAPDSPWPASSANDPSAETGQFTRLFGSRLSGESIDIEKEYLSAAQSAPPESRPFQQAGEFTRMFGPTSGAPDKAAPAPNASPATLNATHIPSASGLFGSKEDLAKYAAEALAASKPADAGPGEYTRMFAPPARQGEQDQAAQPAAPKPPNPEMQPGKKSRKTLIVIVVVAAVLILAIVLLIVLGRGSH